MDTLCKNLSREQVNELRNIKVSAWDIIMSGSGGHPSITNLQPFSILSYRKDGLKLYFGTESFGDVMRLIQKDFVQNLKEKIDLAKEGKEIAVDTKEWGLQGVSESLSKIKSYNSFLENENNLPDDFEKPVAEVIGKDGNVFNLAGICSSALKRAGYREQAKEMTDRIFKCGSYDEALQIMAEYCELE